MVLTYVSLGLLNKFQVLHLMPNSDFWLIFMALAIVGSVLLIQGIVFFAIGTGCFKRFDFLKCGGGPLSKRNQLQMITNENKVTPVRIAQ